MFQESRGSGGSAVLPLYLRTKSGDLFEKQAGSDLIDAYDSTAVPKSSFDSVGQRFGPMADQAQQTAAGIFNGGVQKQMEDNAAPVQKARVSFSRQSAMDALNKTLGEINAAQAGQGYSGDSLGSRMLTFNANKGASDAVSAANLQNLEENRGIADAALNLRLSNLNLPNQEEQAAMQTITLPDQAYLSDVSSRLQPMTFLRIGGSQPFQNQNLPMVPTQSSALQLMAQGNAGVGNAALSYWLNKQNAQNYANAMKGGGGTGTASSIPASQSFSGDASGAGYGGGYAAADPGWEGFAEG